METKSAKKRNTVNAKNIELSFTPSKKMKKEPKLESLQKSKLLEKIIEMRKSHEKEIDVLNEKVVELEKVIDDLRKTKPKEINKSSVTSQTETLEDELVLPCVNCTFTAFSEMELRVHLDYVHDKGDSNFDTSYICKVCKRKFLEKGELMKHIKINHENSLPICKFYLRGICNFEDNLCWYKHKRENKSPTTFKCGHCEKSFTDKNGFMHHRKSDHLESVQICRFHNEGSCRFNNRCWFRHESNRSVEY